MKKRYPLPAGSILTATINRGDIHRADDPALRASEGEATFGPYTFDFEFITQGDVIVSIERADVLAIPVRLGGGDVYELFGDEAPVDGAQASLSRNPAGDENALTFTAVAYGASGNDIAVAYVDPEAEDAELSVSVIGSPNFGFTINVSLATDEAGDITSTAAEVLAAVEASAAASELVTVAIDDADTGAADDGSGVVTALAAAALEGGEGTGVGFAGTGSRYTATGETVALYINTGTAAAPVWVALAEAS